MGSEQEPQITEFWCHECSQITSLTAETDIDPVCSFCSSSFVEEIDTTSPDQNSTVGPDVVLNEWIPVLESLMNSFPKIEPQDSDYDILKKKRHRKEVIEKLLDVIYIIKRHRGRGNSLLRSGMHQNQNMNAANRGISEFSFGPQLDHILMYLAENPPSRYYTDDLMMPKLDCLLQYIDSCDCANVGVSTVQIDQLSSGENCPICLDEFVVGQDVSKVPCKHMFHSKCIKTWLEMHNSCPVCRFMLPGQAPRCITEDTNSGMINRRRRPRFWVQSRWLFCMCFCRGHGPPSSTSSL